MNKPTGFRFCFAAMLALACLLFWPPPLSAAEGESPLKTPPVAPGQETQASTNNAAELRAAQEAIEQLRREIESSTARNAEAINAGLSLIEPTLARMHERQMEAVQSSNRTLLIVAGVFAAVGFLGLVFISLILVRAIGRFSEWNVGAAPRALLGTGRSVPALDEGEVILPGRRGAAEQATGRFQGAIDQLQRRIQELGQGLQSAADSTPAIASPASSRGHLPAPPAASNIQPLVSVPAAVSPSPAETSAPPPRASVLAGKGQALLNLDAAEAALQCFEEALTLEPGNADTLVKKGMALEKLQDWEQALESYNRAIAIDGTLTVAYLYRGGVCNRLQRFREALESYEQALRTEKKSRAS